MQGDNLEALKALLPYYRGQVDCIFIDPPYNTGNEGWQYNDNVNSPEIRQWLKKTVGKEGEDLSRHDKWLCMMYPRLRLLHEFLAEDMANWGHHVRLEANDSRHPETEKTAPTQEDAEQSLEFVLALAEILFALPARVTRGLAQTQTQE